MDTDKADTGLVNGLSVSEKVRRWRWWWEVRRGFLQLREGVFKDLMLLKAPGWGY